ncbi:MAG: adenylate/guanylate cyclase domain-containing protein [Burkholderiales bacterium]|nr:adenylate/guanylate cyclase domain-containing protein [Burkholderiales bacterium]
MFVDIASFSQSISMPGPADFARLISDYLSMVVDCILDHNGIVDTYQGTCIMAHWDSPVDACRCANDIVRRINTANTNGATEGLPQPGIGINTGHVMIGNFGSKRRMAFAVMGDSVNLASRLCGLAYREYPHSILLTDRTRRVLPESMQTVLLPSLETKGSGEPIGIYALIT